MKKFIIWQKIAAGVYKRTNYSHNAMITLALFLIDGLSIQSYIQFLENGEQFFSGNIADLEKNGDSITIILDEYVFPNMPTFTTTIKNLVTILQEYRKLEKLNVEHISIILDNEQLLIEGY